MWSSRIPNKPYLLYSVVAFNVFFWLILEISGGSKNVYTLNDLGAINPASIYSGQYWRLFTAIFMHIGIMHLVVNTISIFIIGTMVDRFYGSKQFLFIYLVSGIVGSLSSYAFMSANTVGAGASGAVFGCLGALLSFFLIMRSVLGEFGRQNFNAIALLAVVNLGFGFIVPGIDNWAHLGGLAAGFLIGVPLTNKFQPPVVIYKSFLDSNILGCSYRSLIAIIVLVIFATVLLLVGNIRTGNTFQGQFIKATNMYEKENFPQALKSVNMAIESIEPNIIPEFFLLKAKIALAQGNVTDGKKNLELAIYTGLSPNDREEAVTLLRSISRSY